MATKKVTYQAFLDFVGDDLPKADFIELPILTGDALRGAAMLQKKKNIAGALDGWAWNKVKATSLSWFVGLASVLRQIESEGRWPQGRLHAYIALIPEAEGDSTPLRSPTCVPHLGFCSVSPHPRMVLCMGP